MNDDFVLEDDKSIWLCQDIKKALQEVYDHYRSVKNINDYLRKEVENLKSEHYKDEQLSEMKKKYDSMASDYYRGFPITEEEDKKITEWTREILRNDSRTGGAIGGRFTYEFTPTGVGTVGTVIDGFTGNKFTFREL